MTSKKSSRPTPTSSTGPSMSAAAPSASTCRSISSLRTTSSRKASIVTKGFKVRPAVQQRILAALQRPEFEQVQPRVSPLELGPPVGWPLKFRISGPDPMKVREIAQNFASLLGKNSECPEHQLRLERAVQGGSRRGGSGPGSGAGHQFAGIEPDHQCRSCRARPSPSCATTSI